MTQSFKMRKLVDEYKTIFLGNCGNQWKSSKSFSLYLSFLWNSFKACQKPKSNLIRLEILVKAFKMRKLVDQYKAIFPAKPGKHWKSSKIFSLYLSFLSNHHEACQGPKLNLIRLEIMTQGFKMTKLVDEYKSIFLGKRGKHWNSCKTFSLYLSFL